MRQWSIVHQQYSVLVRATAPLTQLYLSGDNTDITMSTYLCTSYFLPQQLHDMIPNRFDLQKVTSIPRIYKSQVFPSTRFWIAYYLQQRYIHRMFKCSFLAIARGYLYLLFNPKYNTKTFRVDLHSKQTNNRTHGANYKKDNAFHFFLSTWIL